ncbi:MAG: glycerophosphoryl diester phosphodiesterase membrane domain-containing protein [Bacteroidota bacterium]
MSEQNLPPAGLLNLSHTGYRVEIGRYIGDAFNLFGKNAGGFIVFGIVAFFIAAFGGLIAGLIPVAGNIISSTLSTTLLAGFMVVSDKMMKGQNTEFSDFFGAMEKFVPILLYTLVVSAIIFIPIAGVGISLLGFESLNPEWLIDVMQNPDNLEIGIGAGVGAAAFIFALFIYVNTSYLLTVPLIIFQGLGFWDAMEASRQIVAKNFFSVFAFTFVTGLLTLLGALLLGVGLLVMIPVWQISIYFFYRHLMDQAGVEGKDSMFNFDEDAPLDSGF